MLERVSPHLCCAFPARSEFAMSVFQPASMMVKRDRRHEKHMASCPMHVPRLDPRARRQVAPLTECTVPIEFHWYRMPSGSTALLRDACIQRILKCDDWYPRGFVTQVKYSSRHECGDPGRWRMPHNMFGHLHHEHGVRHNVVVGLL